MPTLRDTPLLVPALAFAAACMVALVLTPLVRAGARAVGMIAPPTQDRWHRKPTALLGGMAIYGGFVAAVAVALPLGAGAGWAPAGSAYLGVLASSTLMFVLGLVDDRLRLRPSTKLVGQTAAAAVAVSLGVVYPLTPWPVLNVLATVFWFLAVTNALNLLDNMDGVATGVGAIAAAWLAVTFALDGQWALSAVCMALAGACAGYLPYNFNPASIFMGDSGSLFIGSLLAGLGAAYPTSASGSVVSVLFVPALIVIIPILDTLLVTTTRTLAGRSISVGGRDHTSHRLVAMGLSQRQTALLLYAFATLGGGAALLLRGMRPELGLSVGAVFLVALLVFAAYLGGLHTYVEEAQVPRRATLLITDLLHKRRAAEVLLDLVLFAVAYQGAYLVRYDGAPPPEQRQIFAATLALAVVCKSIAFGVLGVYRGTWRHVTVQDVLRLAQATLLGSLLTVASLVFFFRDEQFARGILVVDALLVGLLAVAVRASFRSLELVRHSLDVSGAPVLVYGAGRGGELAIRELRGDPGLRLRPVAFLDDDPAKLRRLIHGVPVLGGAADLGAAAAQTGARTLVIATRKLSETRAAGLREACRAAGVEVVELRVEFRTVLPGAPVPAPAPAAPPPRRAASVLARTAREAG